MRFLNFGIRYSLWAFVVLLMVAACKPKKKMIKSPPGYNFGAGSKQKVDYKLKEISGIAWDSEREEFLAHYDEKGTLFTLDKESKKIKREYVIAKKGDFEDIAIYRGTPYMLESNGTLHKVTRDGDSLRGEEIGSLGLSGTNDFETLYSDTARHALILLCKNCDMDGKNAVSAFAYYPDSAKFSKTPVFTVDAEAVKNMAPSKTSKLQPSAAGIHPKTGKLIIISSASSLFVIADPVTGKPEQVFEIGKKLFPQPEGLTFKSSGYMFISNEGMKEGTILGFEYKDKTAPPPAQ